MSLDALERLDACAAREGLPRTDLMAEAITDLLRRRELDEKLQTSVSLSGDGVVPGYNVRYIV